METFVNMLVTPEWVGCLPCGNSGLSAAAAMAKIAGYLQRLGRFFDAQRLHRRGDFG